MPGISASTTRLAAVAETAWAVTPATPAFKNLRIVSESLSAEKQTTTSNELRPDRNVSDVIQTSRAASGSIEAEMSYGSFDDLIESALYSTWATNTIKNGVIQKSFTLEKTLRKTASLNTFMRYKGTVVNSWSLGISSGQLITSSFGVMSKGIEMATTAITGATYAVAGTSDVMSAATDFANLTATGVTATPVIESINFAMTNNTRQRMAVGSLDSQGIGEGRFELTGSMNAYFDDEVLYNAFLAHSALSLSFTLGSVSGSKYTITIPKLKLTSGTLVAGGNDQDLMLNVNFQALIDGTLASSIKIDRAVV